MRPAGPNPGRSPGAIIVGMAGPILKTLDRLISKAGLGSRSDARRWISEGRIQVNGKAARSAEEWVDPERDRVTLDGRPLEAEDPLYVLLYKPRGYVTTYKDPDGRPTVYDLLQGVETFVGTVGRLDLDTTGLLLLTNDNPLADRLTDPRWHVPKTYLVKSSTLLTEEQLQRLRDGVELDDGPTRPAQVQRARDSETYTFIELTISEGRNRQVRRMLEAVGSRVLKLVRTRIGPLTIGDLPIGRWRPLTVAEVRTLRQLVGIQDNHAHSQSEGKLLLPQGNRAVLGGRRGKPRLRDRTR